MSRRFDERPPLDPGEVRVTAPTQHEIVQACEWLRKLLRAGPIYANEALRLAEAAGIRSAAIKLAKSGVAVSENWNDQNPHAQYQVWFWCLDENKDTGLI
jgi:hypothetical protein